MPDLRQAKTEGGEMRTIRFRLWTGQEMIQDPIIYGIDGNQMAVGSKINEGIKNLIEDGEGKYSLMQFTGLKDKNGKEIYEGDIFGNIQQLRCVVEWEPCRFILRFLRKDMGTKHLLYNKWAEKSEALGNIHENPSLLEESAEKF